MSKELFISTTPHETKLAIVENEEVTEIYFERENEYTLAGSIYKGKVTRVLPGMQSAFVDIGLERDAFLYVTDFMEMEEQEDDLPLDTVPKSSGARQQGSSAPAEEEYRGRGRRDRERGRQSQRELARDGARSRSEKTETQREAAPQRETLLEQDFSGAVQETTRHAGAVIPETATDADGGARRYEGR